MDAELGTTEEGSAIQTALNVVKGPDGKLWVSHTIQLQAMSFTYGIPIDQATVYGDNFAAHMRSLVKEAKRVDAGIVLPSDGTTVRTKTGIHVPRTRRR